MYIICLSKNVQTDRQIDRWIGQDRLGQDGIGYDRIGQDRAGLEDRWIDRQSNKQIDIKIDIKNKKKHIKIDDIKIDDVKIDINIERYVDQMDRQIQRYRQK